jgi:hypothetical protein
MMWRLESRLRGIQFLKSRQSILGVTVPVSTPETVRQIIGSVTDLEGEVERISTTLNELTESVALLRKELRHYSH